MNMNEKYDATNMKKAVLGTTLADLDLEKVSQLYDIILEDLNSSMNDCYDTLEELLEEEFDLEKDYALVLRRLIIDSSNSENLTAQEKEMLKEIQEQQGSELDYCNTMFKNMQEYEKVLAILATFVVYNS